MNTHTTTTVSTTTHATLYDIETRTPWRTMPTQSAANELDICRTLGDTVQEYETTDRAGTPHLVALQINAPREHARPDEGGIYVIPLAPTA